MEIPFKVEPQSVQSNLLRYAFNTTQHVLEGNITEVRRGVAHARDRKAYLADIPHLSDYLSDEVHVSNIDFDGLPYILSAQVPTQEHIMNHWEQVAYVPDEPFDLIKGWKPTPTVRSSGERSYETLLEMVVCEEYSAMPRLSFSLTPWYLSHKERNFIPEGWSGSFRWIVRNGDFDETGKINFSGKYKEGTLQINSREIRGSFTKSPVHSDEAMKINFGGSLPGIKSRLKLGKDTELPKEVLNRLIGENYGRKANLDDLRIALIFPHYSIKGRKEYMAGEKTFEAVFAAMKAKDPEPLVGFDAVKFGR